MFLKEINESVHRRLDDLSAIARDGDDYAVAEVARSEMPHLVDAVRMLMAEHEPNEVGVCPACSRIVPRWRRPWCHPKAPCRIYLAARWALFDEYPYQPRRVPR